MQVTLWRASQNPLRNEELTPPAARKLPQLRRLPPLKKITSPTVPPLFRDSLHPRNGPTWGYKGPDAFPTIPLVPPKWAPYFHLFSGSRKFSLSYWWEFSAVDTASGSFSTYTGDRSAKTFKVLAKKPRASVRSTWADSGTVAPNCFGLTLVGCSTHPALHLAQATSLHLPRRHIPSHPQGWA